MVAYSFGLVGQLGKNSDAFSQSTPPFTFVYPQLSAIALIKTMKETPEELSPGVFRQRCERWERSA
jgi:hypothetical protein